MLTLAGLIGGLALLCIMFGLFQRDEARVRDPALAVARASGAVGAADVQPAQVKRAKKLPAMLGYISRRAKTAGVEWDLETAAGIILSAGLVAALVFYVTTGVPWIAFLAFLGGFYAPIWRLEQLTKKRAAAVLRQLDQACTELIQQLSSGLDLHSALLRQTERPTNYVIAELRRVMRRVRDGEPLPLAMPEFAERIALEEARLFSIGIALAIDSGTRIVPVLESVQRSLRGRREMHGLLRELSSREEKQSLILMAVPVVMIIAMRSIAPQYTDPLLRTTMGQIVLLCDFAWMLFGLQIIKAFVNGTAVR